MALGEAAQRLIEEPVTALVLDRIEQKLMHAIRTSDYADTEAREHAYRLYRAALAFRQELVLMAGAGRLEAKRREE